MKFPASRNLRITRFSNPRILDVVWPTPIFIDLRMKKIDFAAKLSYRTNIWPVCKSYTPPMLTDDAREHLFDDVMPCSKLISV
ncbi:MAG: hypothetical protein NTY46_06105 [Candidatus Sumerlaeota bacterium]|nr:hypothetical protein [Candidatus Sumerlaeota bacterium]